MYRTQIIEIIDNFLVTHRVRLKVIFSPIIYQVTPMKSFLPGNKLFKLHYNIHQAKLLNQKTLVTFGGPYSNHICATAIAASQEGLSSIAIVPGEELAKKPLNDRLRFSVEKGLKLVFVPRSEYKLRNQEEYLTSLSNRVGSHYLLPEGGTNELAIRGCAEMIRPTDIVGVDRIFCPTGTGGTLAGIALGLSECPINIFGIAALPKKVEDVEKRVQDMLKKYGQFEKKRERNWEISYEYVLGSYGRPSSHLVKFCKEFEEDKGIPLDVMYSGKMFFAIYDFVNKGVISAGETVLAVHSGGWVNTTQSLIDVCS
eukprot:TRINITY_DN13396_c0_g1_i1.p1 TRINITY_DN13396_c0_g1~~TRINITY_DN13396_c0_g1_i1.p1  ORF type:complete len:313 (+),score=41.26 TRINITY_DN13396_c0_g1_i1:31-969(+)